MKEQLFQGICSVHLRYDDDGYNRKFADTKINLSAASKYEKNKFHDLDGVMNAGGVKVLTDVFIQGLLENVRKAHARNLIVDADHLQYILHEIESAALDIIAEGIVGDFKENTIK